MNIEDYGLSVRIRNKSYPLQKELVKVIREAISRDLAEEGLPPETTYSYNLRRRGLSIGRLISYSGSSTFRVSMIIYPEKAPGLTNPEVEIPEIQRELDIIAEEFSIKKEA